MEAQTRVGVDQRQVAKGIRVTPYEEDGARDAPPGARWIRRSVLHCGASGGCFPDLEDLHLLGGVSDVENLGEIEFQVGESGTADAILLSPAGMDSPQPLRMAPVFANASARAPSFKSKSNVHCASVRAMIFPFP